MDLQEEGSQYRVLTSSCRLYTNALMEFRTLCSSFASRLDAKAIMISSVAAVTTGYPFLSTSSRKKAASMV